MASTAISAQGSTVSIGTTTGSAINITAVALTNPCRVTLASVTGLNKGDVLTIAGVVGTTQLNGNNYVIQYIEPTTKIVTLAALDATRAGLDPHAVNPLDALRRPHVYSDWWLTLRWLGIGRESLGDRGPLPRLIRSKWRALSPSGGRGGSALLGKGSSQ